MRMGENKGQVTIFIIIGIVLVVAIVGMFVFLGDADVDVPVDLDPKEFVDKCVRDVVEESVELMLNGGEASMTHSIMYDGAGYNYLCYQADYYLPCYNIHPMLETQIEEEIYADTFEDVQDCFDSMSAEFQDQGYEVGCGNVCGTVYTVDLVPGNVRVNLRKEFYVSRGEAVQNFDDFDTDIVSAIWELVGVARDVVNSESTYCHFERNGYMLLYPRYDIHKTDYSDSKIYRVTDEMTEDEFKFAVRSCAFALGI